MHTQVMREDYRAKQKKFQYNEININKEISTLENISKTLFTPTEFGLSLQEMFAQSYNIGKDTGDYKLYKELINTSIIRENYSELYENLRYINDKNIPKLYVDRQNALSKNPMIVHLKNDLDIHKLKEVYVFATKVANSDLVPFVFSQYPHSRYLATF